MVVIGSDSNHENIFNDSSGRYFTKYPKIYKSQDYYYSIAGFINEDFHVASLLNELIKRNINVDSTLLKGISSNLANQLRKYMIIQKRNNSKLWKRIIKNNGLILNIAIVGNNYSNPNYSFIGLYMNDSIRVNIKIDQKYYESSMFEDEDWRLFCLGESTAIDRQIAKDSTFFKDKKPGQIVNELIKIECEKSPETVSEPIDILEIHSDSIYWLKRSSNCPIIFN